MHSAGKSLKPIWDKANLRLKVGAVTVKQYVRAKSDQILILESFEEQKWPYRIDDPLPGVASVDPRARLRRAIRALNTGQRLIRFLSDGKGIGVAWRKL